METAELLLPNEPEFICQLKQAIESQGFSPRTEHSYLHWIYRFISFNQNRSPKELGEKDVRRFLRYVATTLSASPARCKQALKALRFMYQDVLKKPLPGLDDMQPA
ncbi:integrase [Hahella sp. KA22]|uniref:site-specific integrase n=1 Tax=Hahella sp. KA22 TaxID=1628392 RepID=UPI000FDCE6D2|nr:site-specific integrase [Hahella sp. KA22]AZZ90106.1 integrase [Hahella sp. KA22]QAY53476.1 integrase [Hahella sp. KA22]